jgi:hypothetical protein
VLSTSAKGLQKPNPMGLGGPSKKPGAYYLSSTTRRVLFLFIWLPESAALHHLPSSLINGPLGLYLTTMAPERVNIRSLRRQLQKSKIRSESGQYFVPDISIINILTLSVVKEAVLELQCNPDERIGLAERVHREAKKVFSILVLMSEEDYIVKFREHGCLDSQLPLSEEDAKTIAGDVGVHLVNQQWEVLPESFQAKMWENHREFGMKRILPFINTPVRVGEGGYGEVMKTDILPSQQAFYNQVVSDNIPPDSLPTPKL